MNFLNEQKAKVQNLVVRGEDDDKKKEEEKKEGGSTSLASSIAEKAKAVGQKIEDKLPDSVLNELSSLKSKLHDQAEKFQKEKDELLNNIEQKAKAKLRDVLMRKLDRLVDLAMMKLAKHAKFHLKDPYMPRIVQHSVDRIVDALWPDIKAEVKELVMTGIGPTFTTEHGDKKSNPYAWLRYQIYPYDRSIWRKLRNPIWLFFKLAALVPRWGVQVMVYFILFLLIDKDDEYQVLEYIIEFKALQFINLGIMSSMVGGIQYYICVSHATPSCYKNAPMEDPFTLALFVVQVLLVWIAFIFLYHSKRKGGYYYQLQEAANSPKNLGFGGQTRKGIVDELNIDDDEVDNIGDMLVDTAEGGGTKGRLLGFLWWDLFAFLLCAGLTGFAAYSNFLDQRYDINEHPDTINNWKFKMTLYWIKCLYGYLSFPFIALMFPIVSTLVSHARPTGYNPYGRTVPLKGVEEEEVPWRVGPPSPGPNPVFL